jgi:hypothetical protein
MKCAVHTDVDATGYCRNCGKALCPTCAREVRGAIYDEECLAGMLAGPPVPGVPGMPGAPGIPGAPFQPVVRDSRPGAALALGFIPGLGAVYNGEYVKAIIHVLIFAGLIAALSSDLPAGMDAFVGIALGCFYFYMPIEAYRVAKARVEGEPEPASLVSSGGGKLPIGAMVLIGIGALLLANNFGLLEGDWFRKSWPAALVVLGIFILFDRVKRKE